MVESRIAGYFSAVGNVFHSENYYRLRFSPAVVTDVKEADRNPKRTQREARKQMLNIGIGKNHSRL